MESQGIENQDTVANTTNPGSIQTSPPVTVQPDQTSPPVTVQPDQTSPPVTIQPDIQVNASMDTSGHGKQDREPNGSDAETEQRVETYLSNLKETFLNKGYVPVERGIHNSSSIRFYENELKANQEVLNILKNGYEVTFSDNKAPGKIHLENNKSANDNLQFCQEQVEQWLEDGFIEAVEEEPVFISPLSVATKTSSLDTSVKKRMCLDLSRSLNCLVDKRSATMEDLPKLFDR